MIKLSNPFITVLKYDFSCSEHSILETQDQDEASSKSDISISANDQQPQKRHSIYWSMISSSLAILLLSQLENIPYLHADAPLIIGAFGASAVLLFACPQSPYAHPYNVLIGHLLSACIGVTAFQIVGEANSISMVLAVSVAIGMMQLTHSLHPPGGATALIAVIGTESIHNLGYFYLLTPVGMGVMILLIVAYVTNNLFKAERWPVVWLPIYRKAWQKSK